MENINLQLWDSRSDTESEARLQIDSQRGKIVLESSLSGKLEIETESVGESLKLIRRYLQDRRMFLLCAGSIPNVAASGMSKQMGGGRKVYCLKMGEPGRMINLVDVFTPCSKEDVATIEAQKEFYEKWKISLS